MMLNLAQGCSRKKKELKMGICDGRVVIVTGGGRGLGREYALAFAAQGARVVVNDLGATLAGSGRDNSVAQAVADEIIAAGGAAIANGDDVADWDGAGRLVAAAIETFGAVHTVVNNAGILQMVPFIEESPDNWDRTMRVHLRGHFCVARRAVDYWLKEHSSGRTIAARIINISSGAGLHGAALQAPYAAAKAGIAALTITQAAELGQYGITANAVAPTARTRMTTEFWPQQTATPNSGFDPMDPATVAPAVTWLGSELSSNVSGCVFEVGGGMITLEEGWHPGPTIDLQRKWDVQEVGPAMASLIARRRPPAPVWNT
jgi:NAD(P)-dependent dehydrogenase (short-subunit alcohol dehydrogenase family)